MNEFVADKAKRTTGKPRQAIDIHRPVIGQHPLYDLETVADFTLRLGPATTDDLVRLPHLAALDPLHLVADLDDHPARVAAHERVAAKMLAALDRLEQERLAPAPDFAISRQRRFLIGQQPARDRNQVSLFGQAAKLILCWAAKLHAADSLNGVPPRTPTQYRPSAWPSGVTFCRPRPD